MCEEYKNLLVRYLNGSNIYSGDEKWDIENSPYGRGLVAKKDLELNEVIFCDKALFYGPRGNNYEQIFCVSCYKTLKKLTLCSGLCKFPICEDCEVNREQHKAECDLIRSWKFVNSKYSKHLFRALTIIRGLLIDEESEKIMLNMAAHDNSKIKSIEVEKLLSEFEGLTEDQSVVEKLKLISSILNTNAFEMGVLGSNGRDDEDSTISLRGLFPLAALMNHCCIPNIRYTYDNNRVMTCRASKPIKKGEQIFNSYTKVLWGTNQRRMHLYYSKNFLCKCDRCMDPSEFGSYVSAIKCIRPGCTGKMVASHPLVVTSPWKCQICNLGLDNPRVTKIHDIISKQIFNRIQNDPIASNNNYLKDKVLTILPETNQFTIELKLQIILKLHKNETSTVTEADLNDVLSYCHDIIDALEKLKAGDCYIKGFLAYKLAKTRIEIAEINESVIDEKTRGEILTNLQTSYTILGNSISEPKDLRRLLETYAI